MGSEIHGEISLPNKTILYFENHRKFPEIISECPNCHGFLYSSDDYINILEGKHVFKSVELKDIHRKFSYHNPPKNISYQKAPGKKKHIHCPLSIWVLIFIISFIMST